MTWASTSDVLTDLSRTVTVEVMAHANMVITTYANRTPAASAGMSSRDLGWLKMAAEWQAVWLAEQVGVETRQIAARHAQDGVEVDYAGSSFQPKEYPVVLAPLAARALRNLSWKGSRTLRTPHVATPVNSVYNFAQEESDVVTDWQALA